MLFDNIHVSTARNGRQVHPHAVIAVLSLAFSVVQRHGKDSDEALRGSRIILWDDEALLMANCCVFACIIAAAGILAFHSKF